MSRLVGKIGRKHKKSSHIQKSINEKRHWFESHSYQYQIEIEYGLKTYQCKDIKLLKCLCKVGTTFKDKI